MNGEWGTQAVVCPLPWVIAQRSSGEEQEQREGGSRAGGGRQSRDPTLGVEGLPDTPDPCSESRPWAVGSALEEKRPHSSSLARGLVFGLFHINGASSCG